MSAQRRPLLICYDVAEPRRLRRVFRELRDQALPVQKSVFFAELTAADLTELLERLAAAIEPAEDRLQVFYLQDPATARGLGLARPLGGALVA
jgi:CRISPR-associated protein Cas2